MNVNIRELLELINRIIEEYKIDISNIASPTAGYSMFLQTYKKGNILNIEKIEREQDIQPIKTYICDILVQKIGIEHQRAKKYLNMM